MNRAPAPAASRQRDPALAEPTALAGLDRAGLAAALRPLWEDAGPLADRLVGRPAASWDDHLSVAEAEIAAMDAATQADLLRAHPRIGADPAVLAARSLLSFREQGGAASADPAILARLEELNDRYETTFGFPFVEWVAGRPKAVIAGVLEQRLIRSPDEERRAGCEALVAIARDRLQRLRSGVL
jgi:2-oxo-4-hydroxy-4-carboxy--5-ureidoimidazoline (OHCU) decarboxylase